MASETAPNGLELRSGPWWRAFLLGALTVGSIALVAPRLKGPPPAPAIDTKLSAGSHLLVVVVAPTSEPQGELTTAVRGIIDTLRQQAEKSGLFFTTVGVSDDWSVRRGLSVLDALGPFDEVVVGRNMLNTGIQQYVISQGAVGAAPQVVVYSFPFGNEASPLLRGALSEVLRTVGPDAILAWHRSGVSLPQIEALNVEP